MKNMLKLPGLVAHSYPRPLRHLKPQVGPNSTVCGPSMRPHVHPWMHDGVLDLPSPAAIGFWNLVK
ncbi:hypothetical protein DPMN_183469 [Dreissena polymorpha]|uniref:Uncharacterized protein n=1 Tax=Dreissena polymorpha TaxID=45954 RepID=A0A9D4DI65_DREPO|nr:hypothetical protein DPMN_183469 [Dreissena polymorpha]